MKQHQELVKRHCKKLLVILKHDKGMSTVEYALGCLAAAAIAAVLYTVVNSDMVVSAFQNIISDALNKRP